MKINMVPSNFESIDDLLQDLITNKNVATKYKDFAFIILENNKLPWTWLKEKLVQLLFWNIQGGVTGAGRGHAVYYAKELHEGLHAAKAKGHKYAMVCQIGMVLSGFGNQKEVKTPVQNFYEFCQSGQFMRAHILAVPDKEATIHTQHLEIDLTQWNGQNLKKLGGNYIRGYENIHDDYTPLWIEVQGLPKINNFTVAQRAQKWYTYPDRDYDKHEQILYDYIKNQIEHPLEGYHSTSSIIIREILTRKKKRFYFENNEQLSLREVPWECSVVFYESQFWKPNNVSLLERAIKREEIAELSNFITISCGDSQSLRTFAVHEKMEVCLFVNSEGSIDFAWSEISPKNEYNSNS